MIKGARLRSATSIDPLELYTNNCDSWVIQPANSVAPLAFRFERGNGFVVAPIPGYFATVVVERGRIVTVNYTPTVESRSRAKYLSVEKQFEERRAAAAIDSLNGNFSIECMNGVAFVDYARSLSLIDPTLGIYACYAYARAGKYDEISAIFQFMSDELETVPFDIAMLATQGRKPVFPSVVPGMPLLTQGWMMLDRFQSSVPPTIAKLREFLEPSFWATFSDGGMNILESHLNEG